MEATFVKTTLPCAQLGQRLFLRRTKRLNKLWRRERAILLLVRFEFVYYSPPSASMFSPLFFSFFFTRKPNWSSLSPFYLFWLSHLCRLFFFTLEMVKVESSLFTSSTWSFIPFLSLPFHFTYIFPTLLTATTPQLNSINGRKNYQRKWNWKCTLALYGNDVLGLKEEYEFKAAYQKVVLNKKKSLLFFLICTCQRRFVFPLPGKKAIHLKEFFPCGL